MGDVFTLLTLLAYCFLLASVPVEGACPLNISLNSWEGTVQNANFGDINQPTYDNLQNCWWTITVSLGSIIRIKFLSFGIEPSPGSECMYDYVEIYFDDSTSLPKLCGDTIPGQINSIGNEVKVNFKSDTSNGYTGFQFDYTGICEGIKVNATNGGLIESPMYPNPPADKHINCDWKLFAHDGYKVKLQYDEYDVNNDGCTSNEYLKVYNGENNEAGLLSTACGNRRLTDTSTGSSLFIVYSGGEHSKFKLRYSVERILPCEYTKCLNGGTCTDVNEIEFSCACLSGYTGEVCAEDADECKSDPCVNGATCVDQVNKFNCICNNGYAGATCNEDLDPEDPSCAAEQDNVDGSYISWNSAGADQLDNQLCPEPAEGIAYRKCAEVSKDPQELAWEDPDLSQCLSPEFAEIRKLAEKLKESPSEDDILDVLTELQNITDMDDGSELFSADLDVATDVMASIVAAIGETDVEDTDSLVQLFFESLDNVIDPSTTSAWKNNKDPDKAAGRATSLMISTETMAEAVAKQQPNSETTVKLPNIEFSIKVGTNESNVDFAFGGDDASSSITMPKSLLDVDPDNKLEFAAIYMAKFKSIGSLLNASSSETDDQQQYVNGDIVSGKVLGHKGVKFQDLKEPVTIVIKHSDDAIREVTCVFLNEDSTTAETQWNTTGCVKRKSNTTHTECVCDHLTNFAVLMDVHGIQTELAEGHNIALSVLSYIGGTLSIIGCILSIFIFEFFKLKSDRIRVHENLAGAMAASLVVFLVGIDRTENVYVCKGFAILLHFLLTSMFMWMLVEGIHLYLALVKVFGTSSHIKKYLVLGWGVPLVVIGISVGVFFDKYGSETVCWLSTEMLLIVFVPTVAIVVIMNTAVLVIVVRVMLHSLASKDKIKGNSQDQEETSAIKTSLKAALVLLPLLGLTWVFGFLSVNEYTIIFTYLFAICNSLQGVIFFLFHCLMNVEVKKAYQRRYRRSMAATSSMSTTTTSRVHQPSKRRPSAGTDLSKRRTSISSQESYAYDNPAADTNFDGKSVKRNNESNELKKKALKSAPVKMNDIKVGVTPGTETPNKEKGLVEEAKVAMTTILEKQNNANTISGNMA